MLHDFARAQILGHPVEAARLLEAARAADPEHPLVLTLFAEKLLFAREHREALAMLDRVLAREPHFAPAWNQRSKACWLDGRHQEALDAARRSVEIQPPNPVFRLQLAQIAGWFGYPDEAEAALAPLLRMDPGIAGQAQGMQGELAIAAGRFHEANALFEAALERVPHLLAARMMLGMNQLRLGELEAGWANYAAREGIPFLYPDGQGSYPGTLWQGEPIEGKTLLVHDDQGHGDSMQFVRFLRDPHPMGAASVTLLTMPGLVRLFGESLPHLRVVCSLPAGLPFDYRINSSRLPGCFGTRLETIPAAVPYLQRPRRTIAPLKLPAERRLRVGLAWSGDTKHTRDGLRSIAAETFLRIADVPGIAFHSLQHQVRPSDVAALEARPHIGRQVERAVDFADTAALVAKLDLVVTVDTGVAHLAAALGKPTWIIVHVSPDWRWMAEREDSPWYPTVRLFRVQREEFDPLTGGWDGALARVGAALVEAGKARGAAPLIRFAAQAR